MVVLLFFLLLAPALWQQWVTDHYVRAEAHRATFAKTSTFLDLSRITNILAGPKMRRVAVPVIRQGGTELRKYSSFNNTVVLAVEEADVQYSAGLNAFRGEFTIERRASLPRPTWTWNGFPFVHSQDLRERGKIRTWYKRSLKETITRSRIKGLRLGK